MTTSQSTSIQELAVEMCEEFEIEPEVARRDAEQFVSQLSEHGILLVSDRPIQDQKPEAQ
jgi:hypothetical protein